VHRGHCDGQLVKTVTGVLDFTLMIQAKAAPRDRFATKAGFSSGWQVAIHFARLVCGTGVVSPSTVDLWRSWSTVGALTRGMPRSETT